MMSNNKFCPDCSTLLHPIEKMSENDDSKNDEDLYSLHLQKMDKLRDRQWENAKDIRMIKVKEMLAELEEVEEEDELVEIMIEGEEEEFIPPPSFIPSGFDLETVEDEAGTSSPGNEESAIELPFAPLP